MMMFWRNGERGAEQQRSARRSSRRTSLVPVSNRHTSNKVQPVGGDSQTEEDLIGSRADNEERDDSFKRKAKDFASRMSFSRGPSHSQFHRFTNSLKSSGRSSMVIDPRNKWVRVWDAVTGLALLFTALVTIYEVAFLEGGLNTLFWINRCVDCIFLVDLVLQFFMMYYDEEDDIWVMDQNRIALTYLKSWFLVDLFSILPFDALGVVLDQDNLSKLKIIRIIKLLRLAKLLRVLRAGLVFQRLEAHVNISYKSMQLITFGLGVLLCAHWMACGLHICVVIDECAVPDYHEGSCINWVYYYDANGGNDALLVRNEDGEIATFPHGAPKENLATTYWAAFYWAMMTMSTIGYGDVTPQTDIERVYVTLGMVVGASIYAYMVGNVCSIIAGMNAAEEKFRQEMDSLNQFMESNGLPKDLRKELRAFYRYRNSNVTINEGQDVLKTLTPKLQAYVAGYTHASWLQHTDLFRRFPADLVVELCLTMRPEVYTPDEPIFSEGTYCDRLYVVDRGLVWYRGRVYGRPNMQREGVQDGRRPVSHWIGTQDMYSMSGLHRFDAHSLTYSVILVLRREVLEATLNRYPAVARMFRRTQLKAVVREIILLYARTIRSFEAEPDRMVRLLYQPATLSNSDNWIMKHKLTTVLELVIFSFGVEHEISQRILSVKRAAVVVQSAFRGYSTRKRVTQKIRYARFMSDNSGDHDGMPSSSISLSDKSGKCEYERQVAKAVSSRKSPKLTRFATSVVDKTLESNGSNAETTANDPPDLSRRHSELTPISSQAAESQPSSPTPRSPAQSHHLSEGLPSTSVGRLTTPLPCLPSSLASVDAVAEHAMTLRAMKAMRQQMLDNFETLSVEVMDVKRMVRDIMASQND